MCIYSLWIIRLLLINRLIRRVGNKEQEKLIEKHLYIAFFGVQITEVRLDILAGL